MRRLDRSIAPDCARCKTTSGCVDHKRFTCGTCGGLTHWDDGAADDRPGDCSDCWLRWYGQRFRL